MSARIIRNLPPVRVFDDGLTRRRRIVLRKQGIQTMIRMFRHLERNPEVEDDITYEQRWILFRIAENGGSKSRRLLAEEFAATFNVQVDYGAAEDEEEEEQMDGEGGDNPPQHNPLHEDEDDDEDAAPVRAPAA